MARPWLKLLDPGLTALKTAASTAFEDRLALARAYNVRARHEEAREVLDQLLAEDRSNAEAWFERLLCFSNHAGDEEGPELMGQLESLRDEHPTAGGHLRNLGYLRLLMQDLDGAELTLQQALALNGQDPKALELAGLVQLHMNQPADAKAWLLKALSLNPRDPRTLRLLAIAMEQLGDLGGAEAQLMAALQAEETYYWGWHALGELLLKRGELAEGLRCIQRARSLHVCDPTWSLPRASSTRSCCWRPPPRYWRRRKPCWVSSSGTWATGMARCPTSASPPRPIPMPRIPGRPWATWPVRSAAGTMPCAATARP